MSLTQSSLWAETSPTCLVLTVCYTVYLLLYVDDIILTASSPIFISKVISQLSSEFPMSDLGSLSFFLGIAATRTTSRLFLSQSSFAQEIITRADMIGCNTCNTPADSKSKLAAGGDPISDPTLYRNEGREYGKYNQNTTSELPASIDFKGMGFLMAVLLSLLCLSFGSKITSATTYDVTSYGAKGDGNTDDSSAFLRAWDDLCGDQSPEPTLIIPSDKTFLISPVAFNGPCKSPTVYVMLLGNITAPKTFDGWKDCVRNHYWIYFTSVQGLKIQGPGQIDGQGSIWWKEEGKTTTNTCNRPTALHFHSCNGLQLRGTTHINSPKLHMSINGCEDVDVGNLNILAPGDSPNTDGIDISGSSHVYIHDSKIQTGDDCVAINGGTYDINVTRVLCGPGHGISIGSLGENDGHDTVEQVRVEKCNITGTKNGLRIKTVPYGTGYARKIVFQDIQLENVQNPIIIDQHYCSNPEDAFCPAPPTATAVKVSDVMYTNIYGSSATKQAITFNCSGKYNCTEIVTNEVGITGHDEFSYCQNAQGKFIDTNPPIKCY
ncbi:hypothetical protein Lser_V15G28195 [Lactuca serriola]